MPESKSNKNEAKLKINDEFEAVVDSLDDTTIEINASDPREADMIDESLLGDLLPNMAANQQQEEEEVCIIEDEKLLGVYDEIMENARNDRKAIDDVLTNFIDMVMNDGDSTSSTKEGIVNLLKIKSDIGDKMAKVADLMTRIKLKSKDTFPRFLNAHTHNNVKIVSSRRDLIHKLDKKGGNEK